ncbi:HAD-IA family hydrolase [candidate division WOR-3 bacterium]|nr:HAD-IA family hydrolase [candidate division WOR-3 bacterium]
MRFRNLIWDFDGTLFDTYPEITQAFLDTLKKDYGVEYDFHEAFSLAKASISFCIDSLAEEFNIDREKFSEKYKERYFGELTYEGKPFENVEEVLEYVSQRGRNFLITHRGSESLNEFLTRNDFNKYFTEIVSSDANFPLKPDPASFNYIIDKYKLKKEETLGVGDRILDIEAANSAGIKSCFFDPGGSKIGVADYNIDKMKDLFKILKKTDDFPGTSFDNRG